MTNLIETPASAAVLAAAEAIRSYVRRTPVLWADVDGKPVVLKLEHLQRGGPFKLRGAVNPQRSMCRAGCPPDRSDRSDADPARRHLRRSSGCGDGRRGLARHALPARIRRSGGGRGPGHGRRRGDRRRAQGGRRSGRGRRGGLAAGTSAAICDRITYAVEPDKCCALHEALGAGQRRRWVRRGSARCRSRC
jgi:threonine dehydratase